jgi:hypothetical protein
MGLRITNWYRAWPELNDYSEAECRSMMLRARVRRGDAMWVLPLAGVGVLALLVGVFASVASGIVHRARVRSGAAAWYWEDAGVHVVWAGSLVVFLVMSVVVGVAIRRVLIIRSVLNHLERARCPYCLFSLCGLVLELGAVTCPECGARIVLADEGLTPEDLLPRHGRTYQTWRPGRDEEPPPIPLEPEVPEGKRKRIWGIGMARLEDRHGEGRPQDRA